MFEQEVEKLLKSVGVKETIFFRPFFLSNSSASITSVARVRN